ncbi:TPA: phage terminase large subunit family protein [Escherichia coli]
MLNQETAKAARTDSGYILRAPRRMRVADAVAQYMRVPMGAGNSVPWDPLVAPYVIEPMNCLASREYDAVIFVGPARTGKTIGLIDGWVIYNVICDPADMLIIQMTEEKAREHSKKRLARTFRVSPEVVSRLSPNKNDNNVYDRTFLAGNYLKIGWPSVNIMSSSDYKCVALTDYDRFPEDIDGEGDAFSLASKRTTTFMSSGMTLVESSPGRDVKDVKWRRTSPHEAPPTTGILSLYNRGDRRRWYWPCPHCGEYFQPCGDVVAGFRDIADPVLASEAAYIQCPSCSGRILPEQKRELNGRGVWLRDGESINADGSRYGDPRRSRIASFWMEGPAAAYQTLSQLVYKLLTAEQEYETTGSEETLKTVINTDWGLPYLPRASMEQRKSELLEQRAEPVPSRSVPDGVNFLVATVDVQAGRHRRFVVQVTGYGSRGERWIIDRYNITQSLRGDSDGESQRIDPASYPEDWDVLLTDVFHKSWPLASDPSQQMRLMAMAVDSGGEDGVTDNAYKFWRRCRRDGLGKRIYLFKGDSIRRAKLISRTFPDNTGRTGRRAQAAGDVPLWLLQTDALKDRVNNALWRDSPGPGYVHFPDWLGSWFYDELTYEERSSDGKWSKPGRGANEAFDLMVYAEALVILHGYEKIRWPDAPEWASRETWLECVPDSTEPSPTPEPVSTPVKKQKRKKTVTDDVNPWLTEAAHEKRESVSNKIRKLKLSRFN